LRHEGTVRRFGPTLQALDADLEHKPRVLMAASIHAKREHVYQIHSLTLMLVSQQWLPLASPFMSEKERGAKDRAIQAAGDVTWFWRTERALPPLPPANVLSQDRQVAH